MNKTFAETVFNTDDPIGRRFKMSGRPGAPEFEIVGLVADAVYTNLRDDIPPTVYLSYLQQPANAMTFEVKTVGNPLDLVPSIRHAVSELDVNVPLFDIRTQAMQVQHSLRRERLFAGLATMLGTVALLLSAIGLYGLMAASVTRRTPKSGSGWRSERNAEPSDGWCCGSRSARRRRPRHGHSAALMSTQHWSRTCCSDCRHPIRRFWCCSRDPDDCLGRRRVFRRRAAQVIR